MSTSPIQSINYRIVSAVVRDRATKTYLREMFKYKALSFQSIIRKVLSHAACDCNLATSVTISLINPGSFNFPIHLRTSVAHPKTSPRGSVAHFKGCTAMGRKAIALSIALAGYIPIPRC